MEPIIKIEHLNKEFKLKGMDVHALKDVNLDIYKGDIFFHHSTGLGHMPGIPLDIIHSLPLSINQSDQNH